MCCCGYVHLFPECRQSAEWRDFAIDIMYRYLDDHIDPDGCNVEITKHYQAVATLQHISAMFAKAEVFGKADDFPPDFKDRMERVYDFNMKIMPPDRNAFQFGEGRIFPTPNPPLDQKQASALLESDFYTLERGLELFPDRDDFRWIVTEGKAGSLPAETSFCLPHSGFITMRSSWQRNANFLGMKGSNTGLMHGDHGRNNIVLWAYGRPMLWNTPQSGWDSTTKSLVTVDGKSQLNSGGYGTMEPIDMAWQATPQYDHAASMYDGFWGQTPQRPCKHIRRVLFVKPDIFLVADDMIALDEETHEYEARWVVKSKELTSFRECLVTADTEQPNLVIIPLAKSDLAVKSFDPRQHPDFSELGESYNDVSVGVHSRSGKGNQRFVTLLLPLKAGETNPIMSTECTALNRWKVKLNDGRTFTITLDPCHEGEIRLTEAGGAERSIAVTTGSIDRPFYLHYQNFEVYDQRESKITYDNITHHVAAPAKPAGAQGRFVGSLTIPKSGTVAAKRSKEFVIPPDAKELAVKAIVGLAETPQGAVRFRLGLQCRGQAVYGHWLSLGSTAALEFQSYEASISIPNDTRQCTPLVEFGGSKDAGVQTGYIDRIRVLYPGERESS